MTDAADELDRVRRHAIRLLSELPAAPKVVRVHAGDVEIVIEWPGDDGTDRPRARLAESRPTDPAPAAAVNGPQAPAGAAHGEARQVIAAQLVGVFYRAPAPGAAPFTDTGDVIAAGQQVAIIEAMKLMIPVEADFGGRVAEVLKGDGEQVEYGEPLFAITPAEAG